MIEELVRIISEYKGKSLGIITKSFKESKKIYEKIKNKCNNVHLLNYKGKDIKRGIVIGSIYLAKGLEFEKVVVVNASKQRYNNEIDRNYLYIACSRAMHELTLLSEGNATELINKE